MKGVGGRFGFECCQDERFCDFARLVQGAVRVQGDRVSAVFSLPQWVRIVLRRRWGVDRGSRCVSTGTSVASRAGGSWASMLKLSTPLLALSLGCPVLLP